ncbi:hypothetical protein [Mesorhizobium sp. M0118]|uniref:hypothetical protein n=1 Tax=Mesorhizobium sp. M0118 TaxID=2956884 RepID=UPI003334BDCE
MEANAVNGDVGAKQVHGVTRVNAKGQPIELIGTTTDLETAMEAAAAMGDGFVAGTWSYWN